MSHWTQPLCELHWASRNPDGRKPHVLKAEHRTDETCCDCGQTTNAGIYMRIDPTTVNHPASAQR